MGGKKKIMENSFWVIISKCFLLFASPTASFVREEKKKIFRMNFFCNICQFRLNRERCGKNKFQFLREGEVRLFLLETISHHFILEVIKREPGSLGVRKWGLYGRFYLRHLNELDHELAARLSRAYKPASYYMDIFVSPLATVFAKNIAFVCGSVLAVLLGLTVWDEDVLNVEHVLTLITVLGALVAAARLFIPDENLVFCPERTLTQVISHIHYFPVVWKGEAHTYKVMTELGLLFPYTAVYLLEELLSPIITPVILIWHLRYKTQEIVDFFRNFTVDVVGVGDVCSFAQMEVRRHGNPNWQADQHQDASDLEIAAAPLAKTNHYTQGEDGKTEMSLVHFTITNPGWKPSQDSVKYLSGLRTCAEKDATELSTLVEQRSSMINDNPLYQSVSAMDNMGGSYRDVALRVLEGGTHHVPSPPPHSGPSPPHTQGTSQLLVDTDPSPPILRGHTLQDNAPATLRGDTSQISQRFRGVASHQPTVGGGPFSASQSFTESSRLFSPALMQSGFPGVPPTSSLMASGLPPPPSFHALVPGGLEYTAADMSMSALYLHNIQHKNAQKKPALGLASGYAFQSGDPTPGPGEREPLLRDLNS